MPLTAGPDQPYGVPPTPPTGTGPGGQYKDPSGNWLTNADSLYNQDHSIDPTTGALVGPAGSVPAGSALAWQAAHEQGVWNYRQNLMRSGTNYMRGALGLLQSYRPGGGAAIESGIYQNLANTQFQQAAMTQPLDLLGDWRRDQGARANSAANRQRGISTAVQVAGIAASVGLGLATGGVGLAAAGAIGGIAGAINQNNQGTSQQMSSDFYSSQNKGYNWPTAQPQGQSGQGASVPIGGPAIGPQGPGGVPAQAMQSTLAPGAQGQAPGSPTAPGGQPGAPGSQPASGQGGQGPQQKGGGASAGMAGPPTPGANGDFSSTAYAAHSAAMTQNPVSQIVLLNNMADMIENDPAWHALSYGINQRLLQRSVG